MAKYRYKAKNSKGRKVSGTIEAINYADAEKSLSEKNYQVLKLDGPRTLSLARFLKGVKRAELALFARQMAVMLKAGVTIRRALQVMSMQGFEDSFSDVLARVEMDVSEGQALSRALGRHPGVFDMLFVGMVKSGEQTGNMENMLDRLADHLDREVLIRQKIKAAISYPAFVFGLSIILATVVVQHILPTFINGVFAQEGLNLPLLTQSLVRATNFLNDPKILSAVIGGLIGGTFLFFRYSQTGAGRFQIQTLMHNLPGIREVVKVLNAVRFCRVFGALAKSGLPFVYALDLTSTAMGDYVVGRRFEQVKDDVREGKSLTEAIEGTDLFPPLVIEFLRIGEQAGRISELLEKLADIYEEDLDDAIVAYTSLLEPIMLFIIGSFVGYVVLGVFLPLYQLVDAI